jgi:hypothetical protein
METLFITNGETKLVLIPERETERVLLDELMKQGKIQVDFVRGPVDVLGKPAQGGVIIQPEFTIVKDTDDTPEVKEM